MLLLCTNIVFLEVPGLGSVGSHNHCYLRLLETVSMRTAIFVSNSPVHILVKQACYPQSPLLVCPNSWWVLFTIITYFLPQGPYLGCDLHSSASCTWEFIVNTIVVFSSSSCNRSISLSFLRVHNFF